jgi:hypothetical protein
MEAGGLRRSLVAAAVVALVGVPPADAIASSILYSRSGDIWLSSPDGRHRALVKRGPGLVLYREVAQSNRGTIVAAAQVGDRNRTRADVRLRRDGRRIGKAWPNAGTLLDFGYDPLRNLPGFVGPLDTELSPDGRLLAQWGILENLDFRNPNPNPPPGEPKYFVTQSVASTLSHVGRDAVVHNEAATNELVEPTWYGRRGVVFATFGGVGLLKAGVWFLAPGARDVRFWFSHDRNRLYGFFHPAISPRGDVIAMVTDTREPGRAISNDDEFVFARLSGPPPAQPREVCGTIPNPAGKLEDLTWSPSGRAIAWADRRGVWAARVSVPRESGRCALHGRHLVARGAISPDWGPAPVPRR